MNFGELKYLFLLGVLSLLFVSVAEIASVSEQPVATTYNYSPKWTGKSNISLVYVKSDCDVCFNLSEQVPNLEKNDIHVYSYREVDYRNAQEIIEQYGITVVPSLVIVGEIHSFPSAMGDETTFSGEIVVPGPLPNLNLSTGEVQGVVSMIYLDDPSCGNCFEPYEHRMALQFSGVYIGQEENVSVDSFRGRELIAEYNITKVPTVIMKGIGPYSRITESWEYFGTVEEDGAYVMRNLENLNLNYTPV